MGKQSLDDLSSFKSLLLYQLTSGTINFDVLLMREENAIKFFKQEQLYFIDKIPDKALVQTAKAAEL